MQALFSGDLLEAHAAASSALARAAERVALSPNRTVLLARLRLAEQEALGLLEGEPVIPDNLAREYGDSPRAWRHWPHAFARVFDKPLPTPALATAEIVARWLAPETVPAGLATGALPIAVNEDRLRAWQGHIAIAQRLPPLIAAAEIAASFARHSPLTRGNLVIGVMLGDHFGASEPAVSAGGIVAIGMMHRQIPWLRLVHGAPEEDVDDLSGRGDAERWRLAWLSALTGGALAVVALDQRVRIWLKAVDDACEGKRRSSHLRALADLAATRPSLTAGRAASHLRISRQAATKLLEEARSRLVLREITHGNAFRRYVAAF